MIDFGLLPRGKGYSTPLAFTDLGLDALNGLVFGRDPKLFSRLRDVLSAPLCEAESILARQNTLRDFLRYPSLGRQIAAVCDEAAKCVSQIRWSSAGRSTPGDRLMAEADAAFRLFDRHGEMLGLLRGKRFDSPGLEKMQKYFERTEELEAFRREIARAGAFAGVRACAVDAGFQEELLLSSARLLEADPPQNGRKRHPVSWMGKISLEEYRAKMLLHIAGVLSHINVSFRSMYKTIKADAGFYAAAATVVRAMEQSGLALCFPEIAQGRRIDARGLYEPCLALEHSRDGREVTANGFCSGEKALFFITGANQGGKTTFLRSIGSAQLFAQGGMPVPAREYRCGVFGAVITHFVRDEDETLSSGKLETELLELRRDIESAKGGALWLFNESFATTTVREGEQIARDVFAALAGTDPLILFVTHFYGMALEREALEAGLSGKKTESLVAELFGEEGRRTYRIVPGEPYRDMRVEDLISFGK